MLGITPEYRPMLAVDIEDSTRHGDLPLLAARRVLFEAVEATCADSSIDWAGCHREDLGDGMRLVFPADTPKHRLIVPFLHTLSDRLGRHNGTADAGNRLRLRAALHGGDVQVSEGQVAGHAFAVLTRLLDAPALRRALAGTPVGPLALILSQHVYDNTVEHGYPGIDPASFAPVTVAVRDQQVPAWLHVPGLPAREVARIVAEPSGGQRPAGDSNQTNIAAGGTVNAVQHGSQIINAGPRE